MGEQLRDRITGADCIAYAETCELWATRARDEAARQRLLEMARSWRELQRHLQGSAAVETRKRNRRRKSSGEPPPPETRAPSRRSH